MSEAFYRKYRPQTFNDVRDQNHVTVTIMNQLKQGTLAHAFLFSGPRGVGKTTIARLLSRAVNCENLKEGEPCGTCQACTDILANKAMDVFEIDAASHTGVDNVRENVIESVRFAPTKMNRKVYIIDEVHMLSTSAFNALLKTLEEPPSHALFVLATTEIHKVPETIISRCQRFDFHRIDHVSIVERLREIAKAESVTVDPEVLDSVARLSEGCLRDAESLFGQILAVAVDGAVTVDGASVVLPKTHTDTVLAYLEAVAAQDTPAALGVVKSALDNGVRMGPLMDELLETVRTGLLMSVQGDVEQVRFDPEAYARLKSVATSQGPAKMSALLQMLIEHKTIFGNERIPALPLELLAVKLGGENRLAPKPEPSNVPVPPSEPAPEEPPAPVQKKSPEPSRETKPEPEPAVESVTPVGVTLKTTLDDVNKKWKQVCEMVKKKSATLPVVLQGSEILRLDGSSVVVRAQYQFLADQLNEARNRSLLESILGEVFGEKIGVKAESNPPAEQDELVNDLINEFGGAVID